MKKSACKAQNRSNSGLLREFATPQDGSFQRQVRRHELISASLDRRFERTLDEVLLQRERQTEQLNEEIKRDFETNVGTLAALAFLYILVVALVWLFARKALSSPLREMASALAQFADKDFTFSLTGLPSYSPTEVLGMRTSLSAMQRELSLTVGAIRETADTVRVAATEISQGTQDLALRTEARAQQVQTSTAALQEMSIQLRQTSIASGSVLQVSADAVGAANEGGQRVSRVMQTMESIQDASQRIGIIVSTIDAIAFQTNILALNAAVEAARAGEQGRGFAVVASEVRSLAQRSADAAREIKGLIADTVERIESGASNVREAGESMQTLISKVHSASSLMGEVESAIAKQSREVDVSTGVMGQLDEMTQQNAAMVEENAAASESLKALSVSLSGRMGEFRIRAMTPSKPKSARLPAIE